MKTIQRVPGGESSLSPASYQSFEDAYVDVLRYVADDHQFVNAPRGNASRECIGASFQLSDPRARLPFIAARKANPVYNLGEVLWYLSGREDLGMISYYAPLRRAGTSFGIPVDEGAYGSRIFRDASDGSPSTFTKVIERLRSEDDSKRALLPVFTAADLNDPDSPSVPCLLALHLLLREGQLHMVTYMRANDADRGLLADVFSFTFIQEFAARLLGVELGTYTHHVGSLHVGEQDLPRVRRVLGEAEEPSFSHNRFSMAAMPTDTGWGVIKVLLEIEEGLRANAAQYSPAAVTALGLDPYWQQVVLLLEGYRQIVHCTADPVEAQILDALDPGYRWLLEHRWPERMPQSAAGSR